MTPACLAVVAAWGLVALVLILAGCGVDLSVSMPWAFVAAGAGILGYLLGVQSVLPPETDQTEHQAWGFNQFNKGRDA